MSQCSYHSLTHHTKQRASELSAILSKNFILTIDILLDCAEEDLMDMGLSRPISRNMLRKAKEITDQSAQHATSAQSEHQTLLISMDDPRHASRASHIVPRADDSEAPMLLISMSLSETSEG